MLTIQQIIARTVVEDNSENKGGCSATKMFDNVRAIRGNVGRQTLCVALKEMRDGGKLIYTGSQRLRRYFANQKTIEIAASPEALTEEELMDEPPFAHLVVPHGKWSINGSVSPGVRWVFDLGGRA